MVIILYPFSDSGLGGCHLPFHKSLPPCLPRTEERAGRARPSHQSYVHFLFNLHGNISLKIVVMKEGEGRERREDRKLVKRKTDKIKSTQCMCMWGWGGGRVPAPVGSCCGLLDGCEQRDKKLEVV